MSAAAPILAYGHDNAAAVRRRAADRAVALACFVATLVVVQTAVRVEILNHTAGNVLPRTEPGKWRKSVWTTEVWWRRGHFGGMDDATMYTRPLTPAESARMAADLRRERARNELRDVIETWGLLQYGMVPAAALVAVWLIRPSRRGRHRVLGWGCLSLAVVCGGLMFYRSYFTSLG